jgi:hypothetical protein
MTKGVISFLVVIAVVSVVINAEVTPAATDLTGKAPLKNPLFWIGKVAPDAVKLKVWTDLPPGKPVQPGHRVVIHFKADQSCYLILANISSTGEITIVFPNKEKPDNFIQADREYSLFGEDSKLKLVFGKGVSEARLVFYVSSKPIDLAPLRIAEDKEVMTIPAEATNEQKIFREKIEGIAKEKGFNRQILCIAAEQTEPMG